MNIEIISYFDLGELADVPLGDCWNTVKAAIQAEHAMLQTEVGRKKNGVWKKWNAFNWNGCAVSRNKYGQTWGDQKV